MATQQLGTVLRHVRTLIHRRGSGELSDGELLARFAGRRDEDAFESLVRRHGPLVLGVCRRLLSDTHDADDAFQATFFVLARKATSIRKSESVASWLYGVAHRLAAQLRGRVNRRRGRERIATEIASNLMDSFPEGIMRADPMDEASRRELHAAVDEELAQLPEKYRVTVVLCDLVGKTHAEAARELAWPAGTVKTRLARARSLLRSRLTSRGLGLSGVALAALVAEREAVAAVPPSLLASTVRSALAFGSGHVGLAAGMAPGAAALAQKGLQMLVMSKVKMMVVAAILIGLLGAGSLALSHPVARAEAPPADAPPAKTAEPSAETARTDRQGDPLPDGALARLGTVRLRHGGSVAFTAFLPGDKELLSIGDDGVVHIWDIATGKELRHFGGRASLPVVPGLTISLFGAIGSAVSADGKMLAQTDNGSVRLWEIATGKEVGEIKTDRPTAGLGFAPDGKTLAILQGDGKVLLFDTATHRETRRFNEPEDGVRSIQFGAKLPVVFTPDGKTIAIRAIEVGGAPGKISMPIKLFDVASGKEIRHIVPAEQGGSLDLIFSPDGKQFAWNAANDMVVSETATGKELNRLKGDRPMRFAFTPDGKSLVTQLNGEKAGVVWDVATGKETHRYGKPRELPQGTFATAFSMLPPLAISSDGKRLALASEGNLVSLINLADGKEVHDFTGHQSSVVSVQYAPDGKSVLSRGADGTVRTWDATNGKELSRTTSPTGAFASVSSPDGRRSAVVTEDGTLKISDAAGKELASVKMPKKDVNRLIFSSDAKTLAVMGWNDPTIRLYDTANGKELRVLAAPEKPDAAAPTAVYAYAQATINFSPDGTLLVKATASAVRTWDVATGREFPQILLPEGSRPTCPVITPDCCSLAIDMGDGTVAVYELATGKERRRLGKPDKSAGAAVVGPALPAIAIAVAAPAVSVAGSMPGNPATLAVSSDGRTVAYARGNGVRLWDLLTGMELGEFKGHQGDVHALAFAPDGKTLATGSRDTTGLVWDVAALTRKRKPAAELSSREIEPHWDALTGGDAGKAFDAVAALAGTPRTAVPFLRDHVKPATAADGKQVEKWIADLDSEDFATREAATAGLKKLGAQAASALKKALAGTPAPEARRVAEELLRLAGETGSAGDGLRNLRAVEILERISTPEARALLKDLAKGPREDQLTIAAAAALQRTGK
jgi:RNA polymerase sigma factor (sigma-70 family)